MSTLRFAALEKLAERTPNWQTPPSNKVSDFFGENVFNTGKMQEYLSKEAFRSVMNSSEKGIRMERKVADQVASSMKAWAMTKGVTHYTHWFQPLTGRTAEKHDSFMEPISNGKAIESFGGGALVQQEPDASSFPNGGIRNTFEARGYTAWDPTSPAFLIGKTLCIPTVFVSYTGEALDYKAPLLKSSAAVEKAALDVMKFFDKNVSRVVPTLGWEQEYFLVDSGLFNARPDLVMTGRTLFGHSSSKGQQLDDHYFGAISDRIMAFMQDFETESHLLGIPVTTRHNEVAPNQFELAPMFEEVNIAVDHNQLIMDIMEKVAIKHNFHVLLHEKPFQGMNGSGKHNNWSLATDTGVNLLSPGVNPKTNLRFLAFFVNTIAAVHKYDDLLRATIATPGNDHRLGANEAPPAIISCFIGSQLSAVLDEVEKKVSKAKLSPDEKTDLKLRIGKIPDIMLDNTDRNRTSPFAFTGNKFEFRAVGSNSNCASAMITLNTIMAEQLSQFKTDVDALIKKGEKKDDAIFFVIKNYIVESKRIRFEGDGYGEEWVKEAEKRGLKNVKTTPYALDFMTTDLVKNLFNKHGVFSEIELEARYEIAQEFYRMKVQIESRCLQDMVLNQIIPATVEYQSVLVNNVLGLKEVFGAKFKEKCSGQLRIIDEIAERINFLQSKVEEMRKARKTANSIEDAADQAKSYCDNVFSCFDEIRYNIDKLEILVDNELWPVPKYREMLFTK
ncbi:MAG: glutamine synthetase type III [Crocinitomicaceae bacterium]|nr:glutamine synthetase type III [Crocinitomicaceae bacterium]|tara:strand:- start:14438 stop:16624 length:2187 start_codon:yes stop_codon:yes gene_type:complete